MRVDFAVADRLFVDHQRLGHVLADDGDHRASEAKLRDARHLRPRQRIGIGARALAMIAGRKLHALARLVGVERVHVVFVAVTHHVVGIERLAVVDVRVVGCRVRRSATARRARAAAAPAIATIGRRRRHNGRQVERGWREQKIRRRGQRRRPRRLRLLLLALGGEAALDVRIVGLAHVVVVKHGRQRLKAIGCRPRAHDATDRSRQQVRARGRKRDAANGGAVAEQHSDWFKRAQIPHAHRTVVGAGRNELVVGRHSNVANVALVAAQHAEQRARRHQPHFQPIVVRTSHNTSLCMVKRNTVDRMVMSTII